jgi:glutamyl-Q tRNA(Asp) synthetase
MTGYIGRFAPSPTGPMHLGSLYAALASYLDARANNGLWLLRVEDIDPPREVSGATETILRQLECHGLHWDGPPLYQHERLTAYEKALAELAEQNLVYPCSCTRARVRSLHGVYDQKCRARNQHLHNLETPKSNALRLRLSPDCQIHWRDVFQGHCQEDLNASTGDFVIVRRDGLVAYQLAVSIDDAFQGVTHVIRGGDLLTSTARQIYLLQCLGYRTPEYGHVSVLHNATGAKLSKQSFAPPIQTDQASANIELCLKLLGLRVPKDIVGESVDRLLTWATEHWDRGTIATSSINIDGA